MSGKVIALDDIFTPNDTPTVTYVGRDDLNLEEQLRVACSLRKIVVSVSGPSKSGKTVLIEKVLKQDDVIPVVGAGIIRAEQLWERVLQWMGTPTLNTLTKNIGYTASLGGRGGGEVGVPLIAKGKAEVNFNAGASGGQASADVLSDGGLVRVIKEIADSAFVIFVDDFHYIDESCREEVGRQIKSASDNGVKFIIASVPHRADDVVRSNPELRGRVAAVDIKYWEMQHLKMIARQGFSALNIDLAPSVEERLCKEALGSPQLMQTICYCLCHVLRVSEPLPAHQRIDVSDRNILDALSQTAKFTDFSKMLVSLHAGPKTRGQERKEHALVDGTKGDVYRAVLLAIRLDPISMSFSYEEITGRVRSVCVDDYPVGSSVTSCLEQMHSITEALQPGHPVLAWDGDNLEITDPYFAFFLRSSDKISKIL